MAGRFQKSLGVKVVIMVEKKEDDDKKSESVKMPKSLKAFGRFLAIKLRRKKKRKERKNRLIWASTCHGFYKV